MGTDFKSETDSLAGAVEDIPDLRKSLFVYGLPCRTADDSHAGHKQWRWVIFDGRLSLLKKSLQPDVDNEQKIKAEYYDSGRPR